ncbi:MAG: alpha-galactosidase [Cytophagaceae bacterium]|nr:alpha-galactosidase [Cytophagaceae bacterium]MDW8455685.1 alpha-galactosidase [Cytophagaceae bacterium]
MKRLLSISFFTFSFLSFGQSVKTITGHELIIEGNLKPFKVAMNVENERHNLSVIRLNLTADEETIPPSFKVKFSHPSIDVQAFWHPGMIFKKITPSGWEHNDGKGFYSSATNNAPVYSLYNIEGTNKITFSCSEILYPVFMQASINEYTCSFDCFISFFNYTTKPVKQYEIKIRIDTRPVSYHQAINEVEKWWYEMFDFIPNKAPDDARLPFYSTWYSMHQSVTSQEVLNQCKIAKKAGFNAVIVDDGWQTYIPNSWYKYTGDWEVAISKFPNFKEHVREVHDLGMKYLVWFAVPFVGDSSKAYEKLKGKFLYRIDWASAYVVDPRFPEVREHIISILEKFAIEYGIDGFKLDFVDNFRHAEIQNFLTGNGRDFISLEEASDKLLTDIMIRLKKINPNIMIEFRQYYVGPLMKKYGNMFRAIDCPNGALENRMRIADTRILSKESVIHSDMLLWNKKEKVETAALQYENVFFAVPQISVKLDSIPEDHLKMISFLNTIWTENRDVILNGDIKFYNPEENYPKIESQINKRKVIALYSDKIIHLKDKSDTMVIVNAKYSNHIVIDSEINRKYEMLVYDCMGNMERKKTYTIKKGLNKIQAPAAGIVILRN